MHTGAWLLEIATLIQTVQGINQKIVMNPTEAAPRQGEAQERAKIGKMPKKFLPRKEASTKGRGNHRGL
jgi:hypothetical protein